MTIPGYWSVGLMIFTLPAGSPRGETHNNDAAQQHLGSSLQRSDTLLRLGEVEGAVETLRQFIAKRPEGRAELRAHELLRQALIAARRSQELPPVLAKLVRLYVQAGEQIPSAHNEALGQARQRLEELRALEPDYAKQDELEALVRAADPQVVSTPTSLGSRMRSLLGMVVILALALLLSRNWRRVSLRAVGWGLGLQFLFAVVILWSRAGRTVFDWARFGIHKILSFTDAGAGFLFGALYRGTAPGPVSGPVRYVDGSSGDVTDLGLIFAVHVLPTIIFFGSLMAVLYHLGVVQRVVRGIALLMSKTMGTSGAESLAVASNIFVGQTEAPLVVKPYVARMTSSELAAVMCGGFATVAGGILAAYARFGIDVGHLIAASVMSAPAALAVAKIIYPEVETPASFGGAVDPKPTTDNVIDAAALGAADGLKLALNVAAMLMAFICLVALINYPLSLIGLSLQQLFGWLFYPLSWCMGVDTQDLMRFGQLLGTKIALNEFVAYVDLGYLKSELTPRSFTIATYALCGFANFSSIGVQIGGISAIAPQRRSELARLGLRAMLGGALASWLTACVAGIIL